MSKGIRRRGALMSMAVVGAALIGAPGAQAVDVGGADTNGVRTVFITEPQDAQNDLTVTPVGAVPDTDGVTDPAFPTAPLGVLVSDSTTPLGDVSGDCVKVNANTARCTALDGYDLVSVALGGSSTIPDSLTLNPGPSGAATPMDWEVSTGEGADRLTIPAAKQLNIWTNGGNDTITAASLTTVGINNVHSGAGDDQVQLASAAPAYVYCGDGADTAQLVGPSMNPQPDCENVTSVP